MRYVLNILIGLALLSSYNTGANAQVGWFLFGVASGQAGAQQKTPSRIITKHVGDLKITIFYQRPDIAEKIPKRHRDSIRVASKRIDPQGMTVQELFEKASQEDLNRCPWRRSRFDVKNYILLGAGVTPNPSGSTANTYTFWFIEKEKLKN